MKPYIQIVQERVQPFLEPGEEVRVALWANKFPETVRILLDISKLALIVRATRRLVVVTDNNVYVFAAGTRQLAHISPTAARLIEKIPRGTGTAQYHRFVLTGILTVGSTKMRFRYRRRMKEVAEAIVTATTSPAQPAP